MSNVIDFMYCFDTYNAEEWGFLSFDDMIKGKNDAEEILDNVEGRLVEKYVDEETGYPERILAEYNERNLIRSCHVASYVGMNYPELEGRANAILSDVGEINDEYISSQRYQQARYLSASRPSMQDYDDYQSYYEAERKWESDAYFSEQEIEKGVVAQVLEYSANQLYESKRARQVKEKSLSLKPEAYKDNRGNENYKNPEFQKIADERKKIKEMDPLENKVREMKYALASNQFFDREDGIEDAEYNMGKTGDSRTGTVSANHKETANIQMNVAKDFMERKRDGR